MKRLKELRKTRNLKFWLLESKNIRNRDLLSKYLTLNQFYYYLFILRSLKRPPTGKIHTYLNLSGSILTNLYFQFKNVLKLYWII